jgi:UDPglucose--hexose-1-phosphate uridylyltransferase
VYVCTASEGAGPWEKPLKRDVPSRASLFANPHRRFNPLTGEWVLVSPHRNDRPWQGKVEDRPQITTVSYDPQCYLCPGNVRATGDRNPSYQSTFVFDNDYAALLLETPPGQYNDRDLMVARSERGICRVVCFSERHDLTLALMTEQEISRVLNVWVEQYRELARLPEIAYVQIFENRGATMGASNPHPHCQIWANSTLPNQAQKELQSQLEYLEHHRSCLLCDYLKLELEQNQRIVCRNEDFVALVPFWAVWPFEVMLLSVRHLGALDGLTPAELISLADILRRLSIRYDNLFEVPFPYTMGFHQSPTGGTARPEWHLHAHYYPPLLRSATVSKFMVGYEMLASPQRDLTPEAAAERLCSVSEVHYRNRG